jgi:hypothetical protein
MLLKIVKRREEERMKISFHKVKKQGKGMAVKIESLLQCNKCIK